MNNVRPVIPTSNNSALPTRLADSANSNHTIAGNGMGSFHGSAGNVIHVKDSSKPSYMNYTGPYDISSSYSIDDVVYVDPSITYPITIVPGSYICIKKIPLVQNDYTFFLSDVVSAYTSVGATVDDTTANTFRWPQYNNYSPPPNTGSVTAPTSIVDSGFNIQASQSFWAPLGGTGGSSINPWVVYDDKAAYKVGDQVIVDPNRTDPYPILGPTTSSAQLCYGLFQCLVTVPAWTSASLGSGSEHGRNTGSYYYPIYPTPPQGSWVLVSGSFMNRPHWQPISPMFPAQFCLGGVTTTVYVNGVVSGSVFSSHLNYP
jgi:hypothetical protein